MIKEMGEVKIVRVTNIIIENNDKILELQKILIRLMNEEKKNKKIKKRDRRIENREKESIVICQVHSSRNYILMMISPPNYTSLSSIVAIFFATCLTVMLQPSEYSIFHDRDTPI